MQRREFLASSAAAMTAFALQPNLVFSQPGLISASNRSRRILYVMADLMETNTAKQRNFVDTLGGSGFNVLVLSFLQATMADGQLRLLYNDNALSAFAPQVPAFLARLRSGFATQKRIQISIGGWGHTPTFAAIRSAGVPVFVRLLTEQIILPLGLEGIDIDLEPEKGDLVNWMNVHRNYGKTIVDLTNEYKRVHPGHLVTHAPISPVAAEMYVKPASIPDLKGNLLEATRTPQGNNIDWLNVQFYEGGIVVEGNIAEYYRMRLAAPLSAMREQVGVSQTLHFLTPTFEPSAKQPLDFCRQIIADIDARCADLNSGRVDGVALWDYQQVKHAIGDWSAGLESALRS